MHLQTALLFGACAASAHVDEALSLLQKQAAKIFRHDSVNENDCEAYGEYILSEPVGDFDDGGLVFKNVKDGVDLHVAPLGHHEEAQDSGHIEDFGKINVMTNATTEVTMTFVDAETREPVVQDKVAFSLYDMDEGKNGKARVSFQLCDATGAAFPEHSELAVFESDGCFHITSCIRGAKHNEPTSTTNLTDDHLARTATFFFEDKAQLAFKLEVSEGFGGRNFMFSLKPSNACSSKYTPDVYPSSCCAEDEGENCDNAVIDFHPPKPLPVELTTTTEAPPPPVPGKPTTPPKNVCQRRCPKKRRCCIRKSGKRITYLKAKGGANRDKCIRGRGTWCTTKGQVVTKKPEGGWPEGKGNVHNNKLSWCARSGCKKSDRCCFVWHKKGRKWKKVGEWHKPTNGKRKHQCVRKGGKYCDAKNRVFQKR